MRSARFLVSMGLAALAGSCASSEVSDDGSAEAALSGAVFTTTGDGIRVNANVYTSKEAVYLDGGPGASAKASAAALPAGTYYFQVTDPSGKALLSSDPIRCRAFHISAAGVIDAVVAANGCEHATGVDHDHPELGAITVQLMPFADTPNRGGEYKVWVTAVASFSETAKGSVHGFVHNLSKTDNFKVRVTTSAECGNGVVEEGEQCDDGNDDDDDACTNDCTVPTGHTCGCGNGHLDSGEQCDDGNTRSGDGCSATCTLEKPLCGNGVVEEGEQCDDGNTKSGDGCSAMCMKETTTCACGNGVLEPGEQCDDGNTTPGDGCSATCTKEPPCVCGNGKVEPGEQCDDGNTTPGDGCSATCQIEPPHSH
jgi:cysteine-rich repeat protein